MTTNIAKYIQVYLILGIHTLCAVDYTDFNPFEFYQVEPMWWSDHLWYPNNLEHAPDCPCGNYDKYHDED